MGPSTAPTGVNTMSPENLELAMLLDFATEQQTWEDRSNSLKARNYIQNLIDEMMGNEDIELTGLELRIAATVAMNIANKGIVLTSLLGQIAHISEDISEINTAIYNLMDYRLVTIRHTRPGSENNNVVLEFTTGIQWSDEHLETVGKYTEFSYPLPSLRPAKARERNTDSGMHYSHTSVMAGHKLNMHDGEMCLDHVNSLGRLRFNLNHELMDKFDEYEMLSEKAKKAITARGDTPEQFIAESERVYDAVTDKEISFDWFKDSRGRKYPRGYHVSCHGTEYKKHSLEFADKRIIEKD